MSSARTVMVRLQPFFVVLAFVLLGLLLSRQWDTLRTYDWHIRPNRLVASGLLLLGGWLVEIRMWQRLVDLFGGRLAYWAAVRIWFKSAIVRYVPGNIWQPLSFTLRAHEKGIRPETTLASLSLFHVIHVMAVGPITACYLVTWGRASALSKWLGSSAPWWAIAVAAPLIFFLARPRTLVASANYFLVKIGREALPLRLSTGQLLKLLGISLVAWAFFCGGFVTFVAAIAEPSGATLLEEVPHLAIAYPLAYVVAFLSLLTPGGLVVREGMLYLLLAPTVGKGNALVIALAMRAWEIAIEAACSAGVIGAAWARGLSGKTP